jgi:hypothetical protein
MVKTMKILLIVILGCFSVCAQTKDELRKKFGTPIAETFIVRPGIVVTASYNQSGQIRELLIAPEMTDLVKSKNKTISREVLGEIIDELVQAKERGKPGFSGFLNLACLPANDCAGSSEDYENLIIYYNAGINAGVNYAVIHWKSGSPEK